MFSNFGGTGWAVLTAQFLILMTLNINEPSPAEHFLRRMCSFSFMAYLAKASLRTQSLNIPPQLSAIAGWSYLQHSRTCVYIFWRAKCKSLF